MEKSADGDDDDRERSSCAKKTKIVAVEKATALATIKQQLNRIAFQWWRRDYGNEK